jgi:hypothetical protein
VGDESCASCSSSLNLRLCSVCEAINAHSAKHCHSCKAEFGAEPEAAATLEPVAPPREGEAQDAAFAGRTLPAAWRSAAEQARKRSTKLTATLWVLLLVAAGAGYHFYAISQAPQKPQLAQKLEATRKPAEPASQPEAAPKELAKPQTVEVKPPQPAAVSGKISPAKTAPAPVARVAPAPSEPKRTSATVTHVRAGGTALPAAAAAATAAPASNAAAALASQLPAASQRPAANPERRAVPVTHTKAVLTETAAATTAAPVAATAAAAAASEGRSALAETRNDEPAGCPDAVAALGLCKSK